MIKKAIFTIGLPGSGKSTALESIAGIKNYTLISADEIRINHPNYDPEFPEKIHLECVNIAEEMVYEQMDLNKNIIMDGGGINRNYTARIISKLKSNGYNITLLVLNTPADVCIKRNKKRRISGKRFVPTEAIIEKSYYFQESLSKLSALVDDVYIINHFKRHYLFVDMDGVVAEYQSLPEDDFGNINFVNPKVFENSKPVMDVINRLKVLNSLGKKIFILSASPNSITSEAKIKWLKNYMPFILDEDIYFVGNKDYKWVMLKDLINFKELNPAHCLLIDDDHDILKQCSKLLDVEVMHPSKFLTNF